MVDRQARDALAQEIRFYLGSESALPAMDTATWHSCKKNEDDTVRWVAEELSVFADDLCAVPREDWQRWQRILLLLESDGEIKGRRGPRQWHWTQAAAATALAMLVAVLWHEGMDSWSLCGLLFGPLTILLAWFAAGVSKRIADPRQEALEPFGSFGNLRWTLARTPGFSRERYPRSSADGGPESRLHAIVWWSLLPFLLALIAMLFSPLILFLLLFPQRAKCTWVEFS